MIDPTRDTKNDKLLQKGKEKEQKIKPYSRADWKYLLRGKAFSQMIIRCAKSRNCCHFWMANFGNQKSDLPFSLSET